MIKPHYAKILHLLVFLWRLTASCIDVKDISKGSLEANDSYNFYNYGYYSDRNSNHSMKSCKVFIAHIKGPDRKVKENIFWYSCEPMLPVKYFKILDSATGQLKDKFLVADTAADYSIPLSVNERTLFDAINKDLVQKGYPTFAVKGFSVPVDDTALTLLPFLKTTLSFYRK